MYRLLPVSYTHLDVYKRQTDCLLIRTQGDRLYIIFCDFHLQQVTHCFRFNLLFKLNYEVTSTGKVNTLRQTTDKE